MSTRRFMTVREVLEDLGDDDGKPLPRATWQRWLAQGKGPKVVRLPNGKLRIKRSDYDSWLADLERAS